jgi:hypothetical protein
MEIKDCKIGMKVQRCDGIIDNGEIVDICADSEILYVRWENKTATYVHMHRVIERGDV